MSKQDDPQAQQRMQAARQYMNALERGDLVVVAAILGGGAHRHERRGFVQQQYPSEYRCREKWTDPRKKVTTHAAKEATNTDQFHPAAQDRPAARATLPARCSPRAGGSSRPGRRCTHRRLSTRLLYALWRVAADDSAWQPASLADRHIHQPVGWGVSTQHPDPQSHLAYPCCGSIPLRWRSCR